MNESIKIRTQKKIKENQQVKGHIFMIDGREYQVQPGVFSPAIFLGTQWLTKTLIKNCPQNTNVLEIGIGCGCTMIEMLLSGRFKSVCGVDINPFAVKNTQNNLKKYNLQSKVYVSDVLSSPELNFSFEVVYWNYPFHPSIQDWYKLSYIEKSVMDPNYNHLVKFIEQSKQSKVAHIFLGFSLAMGDYSKLTEIAKQFNMKTQIIDKINQSGTICLIKITHNQTS